MTTQPITPINQQTGSSGVSVLGIIFFMLGAPHVYGALKRKSSTSKRFNAAPYAAAVLMAGAIAGVVELSVL